MEKETQKYVSISNERKSHSILGRNFVFFTIIAPEDLSKSRK